MATNGTTRTNGRTPTPYEEAELGFRNYWYPIFSSKEIGNKPKGVKLLGDQVVLMRGQKDGKIYAMAQDYADGTNNRLITSSTENRCHMGATAGGRPPWQRTAKWLTCMPKALILLSWS